MFTQRDIATGQLITKLNNLGAGGGASAINVIDYDPADSANYITHHHTLAGFEPVEDSATIDAANNQFIPKKPIDVVRTFSGQQTQYVAIKMDKLPVAGTITIDYSRKSDYTIVLSFGRLTIRHVMERLGYLPDIDKHVMFANLYNDVGESVEQSFLLAPSSGGGNSYGIIQAADIDAVTLTFANAFDALLTMYGLDSEQEFFDFVVNMGMSPFEALTIMREESQKRVITCVINDQFYCSGELEGRLHLALTTNTGINNYNSNHAVTAIDPSWVVNVDVNTTSLEHIVPQGIQDGTYLKILGSCHLLGYNCNAGDFLQIYANGTKGILTKGVAGCVLN